MESVGIDLELADVAAARYQLDACRESGHPCAHDPDCEAELYRLWARGPWEFPYRQFSAINETMRSLGMGYEADPTPWPSMTDRPDHPQTDQDREAQELRWRAQTVPGQTGIPAFKLRSNDRWLVTAAELDQALAAYAQVPVDQRAALEADPRWAAWMQWLDLARRRGGFEAE
jgi:hypothetical protein